MVVLARPVHTTTKRSATAEVTVTAAAGAMIPAGRAPPCQRHPDRAARRQRRPRHRCEGGRCG